MKARRDGGIEVREVNKQVMRVRKARRGRAEEEKGKRGREVHKDAR